MRDKCWGCKHARRIAGDAHIRCVKETAIVDADERGIVNGWFIWPYNFDPVWLTECNSFEEKKPLDKKTKN